MTLPKHRWTREDRANEFSLMSTIWQTMRIVNSHSAWRFSFLQNYNFIKSRLWLMRSIKLIKTSICRQGRLWTDAEGAIRSSLMFHGFTLTDHRNGPDEIHLEASTSLWTIIRNNNPPERSHCWWVVFYFAMLAGVSALFGRTKRRMKKLQWPHVYDRPDQMPRRIGGRLIITCRSLRTLSLK